MRKIFTIIFLLFLAIYSIGQVKVTTASVNLRSSPEITNNKICVIPKGTNLNVVKETFVYENWTRVDFIGNEGYVHNDFIKDKSLDSNAVDSNSNSGVKYYYNSKGEKVQSPTHYDSPPAGACAECKDGTYSFSKSRRGTCSHHGGVKRWLK